jgi:hypothetical protein
MALGCGLTSVRGNRGKNYENEPLVPQKDTKKNYQINKYKTIVKVKSEKTEYLLLCTPVLLSDFNPF